MFLTTPFCQNSWAKNNPNIYTVSLVNYDININDNLINYKLKHPLISYNERTYISIRDFAKLTNMDVYWNEEYHKIELVGMKKEEIISQPETALEIGKAVIEERFYNLITETTQYANSGKIDMDHRGARSYYEIYVTFECDRNFNLQNIIDNENTIFDTPKIIDAKVTVYCDNGEVSIH